MSRTESRNPPAAPFTRLSNRCRIGAVAVLLATLASCSLTDPEGPTLLRVENGTGWTVEELKVFVTPPIEVPILGADDTTEYLEVEKAYRIATVHARIDGIEHVLQVIDFVGESPLGGGRFTYRLELVNQPGSQLYLTFTEDR